MKESQYDAFISYKHDPMDSYVARQIHRMLERYRIPKKIQKSAGKKRINRVFRDREELAISADLGENIRQALLHSEYLIVICSPGAKHSGWVQKEIELFKSCHEPDRILSVLVDGEPEDAFPEVLLTRQSDCQEDGKTSVEPLAADIRGKGKRQVRRKLRKEILRLIAPILSCSYDELRQRHREYKIRSFTAALSVITVFSVAFLCYALHQSRQIQQQYQEAMKNQSRYLSKISGELLGAGDCEGALKTAMALSYEEDGEERAYVPEQMYALNNALGSYRYLGKYQPVKTVEFNDEIWGTEGCLNESGTVYMNFRNSHKTVFFMDCATGDIIWEVNAADVGADDSHDFWFEGGKLVQDDKAVVFSQFQLFCLDIRKKQVTGPMDAGCSIYEDMRIDGNERYAVVAYVGDDKIYTRILDLEKWDWLWPRWKSAASVSDETGDNLLSNVIIEKNGDSFFLDCYKSTEDEIGSLTCVIQCKISDGRMIQQFDCGENEVLFVKEDDSGKYLAILEYQSGNEEPDLEQKLVLYEKKEHLWEQKQVFYLDDEMDYIEKELSFFCEMEILEEKKPVLVVCQNYFYKIIDLQKAEILEEVELKNRIVGINQMDSSKLIMGLEDGSVLCRDFNALAHEDRRIRTQILDRDVESFFYCSQNQCMIQTPVGLNGVNGNQIVISRQTTDEEVCEFPIEDSELEYLDYYSVFENGQMKMYRIGCFQDESSAGNIYVIWQGEPSSDNEVYRFTIPKKDMSDIIIEDIQIIEKNGQLFLFYNEVNGNTFSSEFGGESLGYHVVDLTQRKEVFNIVGEEWGDRFAVSDDGEFLVSYTYDTFNIFKWRERNVILPFTACVEEDPDLKYGGISELQISGDDRYLIFKLHYSSVFPERFYFRVWDIQNKTWKKMNGQETVEISNGIDEHIFYAEEKPLVAVPTKDNTIQVFDLEKGISTLTIAYSGDDSRCVSFYDQDEKLIVADSETEMITLWDLETGKKLSQLRDQFGYGTLAAGRGAYFTIEEGDYPANKFSIYYVDENDQIYLHAKTNAYDVNPDAKEIIIEALDGSIVGYYPFYSFHELKEKAVGIVGTDSVTDEEIREYLFGGEQ